jgi:hypothetical protein
LTETIWSQVILRLKGEFDPNDRNDRHRTVMPVTSSIPFTLTILSEFPSILREFEKKRWILNYRGTRNGFKSSNFHAKCDGRVHTITLIKTTKGFIFGGFTRLGWDSSNSDKTDDHHESFLFTIRNGRNISSRKFALSNPLSAIMCHASYVPIFGAGRDIVVSDNSNTNPSSWSNLGIGYVNDTGINGREVFTGEYKFRVKEIEVFTIEN